MTNPLSTTLDIDPTRLKATTRTAIASCIALGLGTLVGLDHPQWAAMTVWIVALPTRGLRLERSLARIFGTVIGAIAGVGLVAATGGNPIGLIAGLTLWIGLCAGTGTLLSGPLSYASLLAGYSAAMVALLGFGHEETIGALAFDRVLTICLGGCVGTLAAILFSPKQDRTDMAQKTREIVQACLDHLAAGGSDRNELARLISAIASLDETLDVVSAGSLNARRQARDIRHLLLTLTELLLDPMHQTPIGTSPGDAAAPVEYASDALSARIAQIARRTAASSPEFAGRMKDLLEACENAGRAASAIGPVSAYRRPASLHRDWIGARYAALRTAGAVAVTGVIWLITGWPLGPYMVMGAAIMTSVFSTFPNPGLQIRWVVGGSVAGALAAVLAHVLVLPMATSTSMAALLTMPLILVGAPIMAHRRVGLAGMEYNLIYLLMMNPTLPIDPDFAHAVLQAFAVVLGPLSAYLAFLLIPVDAGRRLDFVIRLTVHELTAMAKGAFDEPRRRRHWQIRLHHRLMVLVRLAERSGRDTGFAVDGGLTTLALGNSVMKIRALSITADADQPTRRALRAAIMSIGYLADGPDRVTRALKTAARRLRSSHPQYTAELEKTAALVAANQDFFKRAG